MWLIVVWKTHVFHPRFLLSGAVILFTIATLMAFAFLIGVITSSTGVSLMATYAVFFFAAILVGPRPDRGGRLDGVRGARRRRPLLGPAEDRRARPGDGRRWSPARRLRNASSDFNHFAVYGSTALFGVAALGLASWLFSRKDF